MLQMLYGSMHGQTHGNENDTCGHHMTLRRLLQVSKYIKVTPKKVVFTFIHLDVLRQQGVWGGCGMNGTSVPLLRIYSNRLAPPHRGHLFTF
jgi:hypothetical protein